MSANCEYYESLMSRMLDGDLLPAETDVLREHIRTCKSCRTLCAAFSGMTLSLRDDLVDVPVDLSAAVMGRIRTFEAEKALEADEPAEEPVPFSRPRASRVSPKKRWVPTVIAACLVLVIGVGAVSALGRGGAKSAETAADSAEMAAYSRTAESNTAAQGTSQTLEAAEAPAAMAEESVAFDMASGTTNAEEGAVEPAASAPEAAEAETAAAESGGVQGYTLNDPAFVPEGSETAFEALLTDGGAIPAASLHVFYYVEHRGVIYEFMTDENEECLIWRDAAEGFPTLSQSSFDDLWAIFK